MKKKSFFTFLFVFASLTAIAYISYAAIKENLRSRQIQKEIDSLKQEADRIRTSNNNLEEKNQYFSTPEFQEKIAKEKLNLQKENESVVIVKSSPSSFKNEPNQKTKATSEHKPDIPNYKKWWRSFFSY